MSDTELRKQLIEIVKHARANAVYFGFGWAEDKNPDYEADRIIQLVHTRERALLAAIRAELPKKIPYVNDDYKDTGWTDRAIKASHNNVIDDVAAILTKYEEEITK